METKTSDKKAQKLNPKGGDIRARTEVQEIWDVYFNKYISSQIRKIAIAFQNNPQPTSPNSLNHSPSLQLAQLARFFKAKDKI